MSLIERLEQADGPSRELDAEIHLAIGYRQELPEETSRLPNHPRWVSPDGVSTGWIVHPNIEYPPRYTSSIDAALTLVPEGMRCRLDILEDGRGACWLWWPTETPEWNTYGHLHATPALALCIAALKAHGGNHD